MERIKVICTKTGLLFEFYNDKEKEDFFDLWDRYEVVDEKYKVKEKTIKEINKIIERREPLGLFFAKDKNFIIAVDNTTGDAWTEDNFGSFDECYNWLHNRNKQ